jgi:electron transfer flavoprotein beta subunit
MNCIVCIKQVPSTNKVALDPKTNTIVRDGKASVMNPFDAYALEEAVRIREKFGGTVTALSMGIPATEKILRDAIGRGADGACLMSDRAFAGADTLATSYALSLGVKKIGDFDLILCGKMAVDGDTAQIGPELAEALNIPHVTDVEEIVELTESEIKVRRTTDYGYEELTVKLPALICVLKDINMPRMPTIARIRISEKADVKKLDAESAGADRMRVGLDGSPTQVVRAFTPERSKERVRIEGGVKEAATQALDIIEKFISAKDRESC